MGGEDSEIRPDTTTVALECATFSPKSVGGTATKLGLRGSSGSAAARRFSWQLSPDLVPIALAPNHPAAARARRRASSPARRSYPRPRAPIEVRIPFAKFARHLGMAVTREEAAGALSGLGFAASEDGDSLVARPPVVRTDIAIPEASSRRSRASSDTTGCRRACPMDRCRSWRRTRSRSSASVCVTPLSRWAYKRSCRTRSSIPLAEKAQRRRDPHRAGPLTIQNPTSPAQSVARPTLRASLLDAALATCDTATASPSSRSRRCICRALRPAGGTLDRRGADRGGAQGESWLGPHVATTSGICGDRRRHVREAPRRATWERRNRERRVSSGPLGAARPRDTRSASSGAARSSSRRPLGAAGGDIPGRARRCRFARPRVAGAGDLATPLSGGRSRSGVVLDEATPYAALVDAIRAAGKALVESVSLVDLYRGPQAGAGKKSFTVRLVLRSPDSTLTDADLERALKRIEGRLLHQLGATIRT